MLFGLTRNVQTFGFQQDIGEKKRLLSTAFGLNIEPSHESIYFVLLSYGLPKIVLSRCRSADA